MHKKKEIKKLKGIIKITAKPLGFVIVLGEKDDIIVFEENLNCALDKDEVEVEIIGRDRDRKKGRVSKIIKRNKTKFVGTIERSGASIIFKPDDFKFYREVDIFDFPKEIESGTKVLVEISWTNPNINPKGKIISVIGKKGEHETEMQSILLDKGIVYDFPAEVEAEAQEIAKAAEKIQNQTSPLASRSPLLVQEREGAESGVSGFPSPDQGEGGHRPGGVLRRDFRNITTFTIDPADAKDFDDALSYEEVDENKIRVGVHIADVSHFVRPAVLWTEKLSREASQLIWLIVPFPCFPRS